MLRAISLRESWMREIRTSGLTRERAPNGPSLLYRIPIVSQSDKQNKLVAGHRSLCGHGIPMHLGRARRRRGRFQISESAEFAVSISEFRLKGRASGGQRNREIKNSRSREFRKPKQSARQQVVPGNAAGKRHCQNRRAAGRLQLLGFLNSRLLDFLPPFRHQKSLETVT